MRRGEIKGLKWEYIDRENWFIRLPAKMVKERKPKNIPINHNVKEVLAKLPRHINHDYVFTFRNKPILENFNKSLKKACEDAAIEYGRDIPGGFIFHDIKGTVKTHMAKAGLDKSFRNALLGHSHEGMARHYLRFSDEDLKLAMDKYTKWLDEQIEVALRNVAQEAKKD